MVLVCGGLSSRLLSHLSTALPAFSWKTRVHGLGLAIWLTRGVWLCRSSSATGLVRPCRVLIWRCKFSHLPGVRYRVGVFCIRVSGARWCANDCCPSRVVVPGRETGSRGVSARRASVKTRMCKEAFRCFGGTDDCLAVLSTA